MKITICIGSSCHLKGSRQVVEQLQYLIKKTNLVTRWNLGLLSAWGNARWAYVLPRINRFFLYLLIQLMIFSMTKSYQRYKKCYLWRYVSAARVT